MEDVSLSLNQTFWHFFGKDYLRYSMFITIILIIAYTTIFFLGIIGNATVIVVISQHPHMKTVTNLFVRNLAGADLFVVVFCVPFTLFANIYIPWVFDTILCKTLPYAQGTSVVASVFSLVAISVDRCLTLYRRSEQEGLSKVQAKMVIYFIWIFGLIITSPWLYVFTLENIHDSAHHIYPFCVEKWPSPLYGDIYFVFIHLILCFLFPLFVITVLNIIIWLNISRYQQDTQRLHSSYNGVTKLLCIITVAFTINWLPLYLLSTKIKLYGSAEQLEGTEKQVNVEQYLVPIAQWMGSLNSCVNPVLYAFYSKKFQDCLRNYISEIQSTFSHMFSVPLEQYD